MEPFGRIPENAPEQNAGTGASGRQVRLGPPYPPGFVGVTYGYGYPGLENPWGAGYGYNSGNPPGMLPPGYPPALPFPRGGGGPPIPGGPIGRPGMGFPDSAPGYQRSDAFIRDDVRGRLDRDPFLHDANVQVQVQDAEVTLTGAVRSRAQKRRARDLADSVPGVADVHNRLAIEA